MTVPSTCQHPLVEPLESGLIIPVPEAEPVVGPHRLDLDSSAAWGVPAHVTVLYPFIPPEHLDEETNAALAHLFSDVAVFEFALASIGWFRTDVVYAVPDPDEPFRELTRLVATRWPDHPPYGGEHGEPTPHLTIGDDGSHGDLTAAGRAVASHLPIRCVAREVWLMSGNAESGWARDAAFPFRPTDGAVP